MDLDKALKKLIFNMWKTGSYQSKLDLIATVEKYYKPIIEKDLKKKIIESVEDVLSNIDKYEKEFKQTKTEQFFIELLQLMKKYNVGIYAQSVGKDDNEDDDIRIHFETPDGTFVQDSYDIIDWDQTNLFEEIVENENDKCRIYEFPATWHFKEEGIMVRK